MAIATKRHMNWTGVKFTPSGGGTAIPLTGVQTVSIDPQGTNEKFQGDGDRLPSLVVNSFSEPMATVEFGDASALVNVPVGTEGTFEATLNDALNHTVGNMTGSITYTLTHAVIRSKPTTGTHRQYARTTCTVECYAPDGQTNPLTVSVAA